MAQTDTRPGFRLPWTAEQSDTALPPPAADTAETADSAEPVTESEAATPGTLAEEQVTTDMIDTDTTAARRPNKFMAELSRAMQGAAETARNETLARFVTEAKTVVEAIHAAAADEAAALRRRADDDVAAVREWSKGEIARIREETESRISARKTALDGEVDTHARVVEARVERVGTTVAEYEAQMGTFFERLMTEEDPTRIATMAETLPDPPSLADVAASIVSPPVAPSESMQPMPEATADPEPVARAEPQINETMETTETSETPDFAAAEAEAAAFTGDLDDEQGPLTAAHATSDTEEATLETTDTAEDLAPAAEHHVHGERATTRVVVLGLVSVASIATFKRSLGRVPGVSAIGVASGPDGEFVFTVSHDSELPLREAIVGLPGFEAKITADNADGLEVAAHDPDAAD